MATSSPRSQASSPSSPSAPSPRSSPRASSGPPSSSSSSPPRPDPAGSGRPRRRRCRIRPDPVVPVAPNASRSAAAGSPLMAGGRGRRAHARSPLLAGLPPDLIRVVFLYLTCPIDRVYFAAVCRAWRSAVRALDALTHPVPLLLLPSRDAPSFFSLHSKAPRRPRRPRLYLPEEARGARFCGSHDGGWVVAAVDPWQGYVAFNLVSRTTVPLPHRLRIRPVFAGATTISEHPMVIRTVTFSGAPTAEDCLAAAHVASASNIAFWRPGIDAHWLAFQQDVKVLEDIIYYKSEARQGFHVLTNEEDVMVYTPNGDRRPQLEMFLSSYHIPNRVGYWSDRRAVSRYLVDSRGKLLMVLRKSAGYQSRLKWKIFEMKLEILPQGGFNASWVELHELRGRALFLGRGCSRAFEVSQFNGLQEGIIYYLDDTSFDMSLLNNGREYSGTDMGEDLYKSNRRPKRTGGTRPFPRKFTSEGSLPIWLFP